MTTPGPWPAPEPAPTGRDASAQSWTPRTPPQGIPQHVTPAVAPYGSSPRPQPARPGLDAPARPDEAQRGSRWAVSAVVTTITAVVVIGLERVFGGVLLPFGPVKWRAVLKDRDTGAVGKGVAIAGIIVTTAWVLGAIVLVVVAAVLLR